MRKLLARPLLPFEQGGGAPAFVRLKESVILLIAVALLEVLAFTVGGIAAIVACYLWIALSVFCFVYLCREYLIAVAEDARHGAFWGLLPLAAAIPLCFFQLGSYGMLNTESLSELQYALEEFQKPDLGYTGVFWVSYPGRSLLINLIPTFFLGCTPVAYRLGFAFPVLFGALFFFAGSRRYHSKHRFSSAVSGLMATAMFAYPTFCTISRSFEMAVSSLSFGLWAIGAVMLFAARPTSVGGVVAAWAVALLAASFTSGMALVALLVMLLALWAVRAWARGEKALCALLVAVLINCVVIILALKFVTTNTIKPRLITFSEMMFNFQQALDMTFSISKTIFTPKEFVIPTIIAIVFALTLRAGPLPVLLVAWCLPVIWASINMRGKISPELPFALYRALIIIPALVLMMGRLIFWLTSRTKPRAIVARSMLILLAVGVGYSVRETYRTQPIFAPGRPAMGREVVAEKVISLVQQSGLTPYTSGWLMDRANEPRVESFLPCAQYFLPNWQRLQAKDPMPTAAQPRQPGIIVASVGDPIATQEFPGYTKEVRTEPLTLNLNFKLDFLFIILRPT